MEYRFKVGDRVMGTKDALPHRVGKFGRVTRPQGKSSVFVLWDGADQDHFVHKNEIVRIDTIDGKPDPSSIKIEDT